MVAGMLLDLVSPLFPSALIVIVCLGSLSRSFSKFASTISLWYIPASGFWIPVQCGLFMIEICIYLDAFAALFAWFETYKSPTI